jgi:ADP-ribosylation factor GTPase-activating protein 2/3
VDLDEWTQMQIDAMRLGGNGNARSYFRKHGVSDMHGKIEKKYNCRAAQTYRAELQKLVNAEAAKCGEASGSDAGSADASGGGAESASTLLHNLDLQDQADQNQLAKAKLSAARAGAASDSAGLAPTQSVAKLASELPGAKGRLLTPPSSGNAPSLGLLRKPSGASSSSAAAKNLLKKKPSGALGGSKLRVNKISDAPGGASTVAVGGDSSEAHFEDVEATQKAAAEAEKEAAQLAQDEAAARKLQMDLNGAANGGSAGAATADGFVVVDRSPIPEPKPAVSLPPAKVTKSPVEVNSEKKPSSIEEQVAKLKMLNSNFFADA